MDSSDSLLITGSTGFVGQSFLDYLGELPQSKLPGVIGLVSRGNGPAIPSALSGSTEIVRIQTDLLSPWNFDFKASKILHLAADGSQRAYSEEASLSFLQMTRNLRSWVKEGDKPIVFHASTGACFGHFSLQGSEEILKSSHSSAEIKRTFIEHRLIAESLMLETEAEGFVDLRIGRLYSFIGRHIREKGHYAVPQFVQSALESGRIILSGNPRTTRSYLSAQDMSEWIYSAFNSDVSSEVLSIGSDMPVTMGELAKRVANLTGATVTYTNTDSEGDYYVATNDITRRRLRVRETSTWEASLESYIAFCENKR